MLSFCQCILYVCITEVLESSSEVLEPHVTVEEVATEEYSEGEDEEYCVEGEEYLEGEEDVEPMFEKRVTLHVRSNGGEWTRVSQGLLSIVYHSEMNVGNIMFKADNGNDLQITPDYSSESQVK